MRWFGVFQQLALNTHATWAQMCLCACVCVCACLSFKIVVSQDPQNSLLSVHELFSFVLSRVVYIDALNILNASTATIAKATRTEPSHKKRRHVIVSYIDKSQQTDDYI